MAATRPEIQSKQEFVKRALLENPRARAAEIQQAWMEAGNAGTISRSLVSKVRSVLGPQGTTPTPSPTAPANGKARVMAFEPIPDKVHTELELDLDRILFRVMGIGGLPEVECQLRHCRRLLILGPPR
jgi:hypothetical protein